MADEGYDRDFPGNPNPVPKAPEAVSARPPEPAAEDTGGGTAVATAPSEARPSSKQPAEIRAVESSDGFELYLATDDDPAYPMGRARVSGSADILKASGAWYNERAKTWEGVPEDTAKALLKGRPGFTENIIAKFKMGEASMARSGLGVEMMMGKISPEDAVARGHEELLKVQLGEQPDLAWKGLDRFAVDVLNVFKHPVETLRFMVGETAEQVPNLVTGLSAAAKGATSGSVAGAAAIGVGLATGPVAIPVASAVVLGSMGVGAAYGAWKHYADVEAGSTAIEMAEKGFDEKTIKELAPWAGVIKGTLEVASFGVMTAPLKRGFIEKTLTSAPVKTALAKWYVTYAGAVGAEVSTELAQTRVDQVVNDYAAQIEKKPELLLKADQVKDDLWATFVKTLAVAAGAAAPGAAVDAHIELSDKAGVAKEQTARAQQVEAALIPGDEPAKPVIISGPVEVTDPEGMYFPQVKEASDTVEKAAKELETGMTTPEAAADTIDAALTEMETLPETYGEKVIEAERKGLIETRKQELVANQAQIKAAQAEMVRYESRGLGTKVVEKRIDALLEKNAQIRSDIEFHTNIGPQNLLIEEGERLSMKPATLESIAEMGFKEGRKEVLGARRQQILDVAKRLELTDTDLRAILKDKNYGTMGDVEFKNFVEKKFKPAAKEAFRRKITLRDVRRKQAEKHLESERNVRLMRKLPSVEKMTVAQMREYIDLLDTFDEADKVLTPKRQRALETTAFSGARTMGEVAKRSQELWGYPIGTISKLLPEPSIRPDITRGMDALAKRSPGHKAAVLMTETAIEAEDAVYMAEREKLMDLGAKALASRKGKVKGLVDPTMPEVMAHLEADAGQVYAGQVSLPTLTPAEQDLVEYIDAVYGRSLAYLEAVEGLKSRFAGKYFTHAKRGALEIINDMKDAGIKATFKELYESFTPSVVNFSTVKTGKNVGLRANMKQMLFRSGELKPSKNVIRVVDGYLKAFHKKKALDRAVPQVDTMMDAAIWADKDTTKEGLERKAAFDEFIGQYLKQKKGQTILAESVPHGGLIDMTIRAMMALPSWAWIAFNPKLQAVAKVGEVLATIPVVGPAGLVNAWRLRFTKEGTQYLKNNEGFTGTPILKRIAEPGQTLDETAGLLMYGMLQMHRVHSMQDVLLALSTKEEIQSGQISPERLAEIKVAASRWMDVKGAKSVLGATSPGAMLTQFKGWGIPILESTIEDLTALAKQVAGKGEMSELQKLELKRIATTGVIVGAVGAMVAAQIDEDDNSWSAQFLKSLHRELFSITGGANPLWLLSPAPAIGYYESLYRALVMTWKMERYEGGEHEGELKGPRAAAKLLPGRALARQLGLTEEEEK